MLKKLLLLSFICLIPYPVWAQSNCPSSQILWFDDGKSGCMKDYKFFNLPFPSENGSSLKDVVAGKERMSIAMVKNPKLCPLNWMEFRSAPLKTWSDHGSTNTLARCEDRVIAAVMKQNKNPVGCECEIVYDYQASPNVSLTKEAFENKTRAWVAGVQNQDRFKGQFSESEKAENTKFLAHYLGGGNLTTAIDSRFQSDSINKDLAEEKRIQQEIAKKEELIKTQKMAEDKRLQLNLAAQQQLELEQKKLAEKVRLEEDTAKKAQLEKIQKELAEKSRLEQERAVAETKKIQAELDKVKALDKEKSEIAIRLQQEKDSREKSLAEAQAGPLKIKPVSISNSPAFPSQTTKSVKALVIGNSNYGVASLSNPLNDAKAIAKRFSDYGFVVELVLDGDRKQIISALTRYQKDSSKYEVNILYYAGHGIQLNGINYLIPTDMSLVANGSNVEFDAIPVNSVIEKYMQSNTKIVFLDACRDNPLSRSLIVASRGSGGASRGLAPMDLGGGTLISYSTKDGNVALDGDGKNSPYTEALLDHMNERIDISLLLRKVRKSVMAKTNGKQVPWDYGSLMADELILSNK
jgi:Caspase domain